jgi:hypothetical protein
MSAYQWEDATSYSRGERGKVEARAWRIPALGLTVHRWQGLPGWFMTSHLDGLDKRELEAETAHDAKREALRRVHEANVARLKLVERVLKEVSQ